MKRIPPRTDWPASCNTIRMHESHRLAAEQHELAALSHRTAAEHNEKKKDSEAIWHAERALAYSDSAYRLAKEAHTKSGRMVSI